MHRCVSHVKPAEAVQSPRMDCVLHVWQVSCLRISLFASTCTCPETGEKFGLDALPLRVVSLSGTAAPLTGSSVCTACTAGKYSEVEYATVCQECAAGTGHTMTGATSVSLCLACTPGKYAPTGSVCKRWCCALYRDRTRE